jgi:hypothetical protein
MTQVVRNAEVAIRHRTQHDDTENLAEPVIAMHELMRCHNPEHAGGDANRDRKHGTLGGSCVLRQEKRPDDDSELKRYIDERAAVGMKLPHLPLAPKPPNGRSVPRR